MLRIASRSWVEPDVLRISALLQINFMDSAQTITVYGEYGAAEVLYEYFVHNACAVVCNVSASSMLTFKRFCLLTGQDPSCNTEGEDLSVPRLLCVVVVFCCFARIITYRRAETILRFDRLTSLACLECCQATSACLKIGEMPLEDISFASFSLKPNLG